MQCELFDGPELDMRSGKMSQELSVLTPAETLRRYLERWLGYALTYRTVDGETPEFCSGQPDLLSGPYWMRNGSEFRSGAAASSLSEILETGPVDRRYFLTPKACRGILRRAEKRGKTLPEVLQRALMAVADSEQISTLGGGYELSPALTGSGRGTERAGDSRGQDCVIPTAYQCQGSNCGEMGTLKGDGLTSGVPFALFNNTGQGYWTQDDKAAPVRKGNLQGQGEARIASLVASTGETSHCLNAGGMGRIDYETETMVVGALTSKHTPKGHGMSGVNIDEASAGQLIPIAFETRFVRNGRGAPDTVVPPLKAQSGETGKGDAAPCVATKSAVRRLTPLECERLQGFEDRYTDINRADGPRYKALGNSMAVPVINWIGRRIIGAYYPVKP